MLRRADRENLMGAWAAQPKHSQCNLRASVHGRSAVSFEGPYRTHRCNVASARCAPQDGNRPQAS